MTTKKVALLDWLSNISGTFPVNLMNYTNGCSDSQIFTKNHLGTIYN